MSKLRQCWLLSLFLVTFAPAVSQVPDLEDPGWRWKPGGQPKTTTVTYQTSEVPEVSITPDPSHRGDYAQQGAEHFFSTVSDGLNLYARIRRIRNLARLGESTATGPIAQETYKKLMQQLAKAGGDELEVPIPTSIHDVALNYVRFESWVADTIVRAGARIGQDAREKWLVAHGELTLETFQWTCAPIQVRKGDGWVDGGYRARKRAALISVKKTRQHFPGVSGEPKSIKAVLQRMITWGKQIKRRRPELRRTLLAHRENPCPTGLCDHPKAPQAILAFEDTVADPTPAPELSLSHRQAHQKVHDLRRITRFAESDLSHAVTNLDRWTLLHKPSSPKKAKELEAARKERVRAQQALEGVQQNRDNAVDYPAALKKANQRLTRAEAAVRKLEGEVFQGLSEVEKLQQSRLRDKVDRARKKVAAARVRQEEAERGHESCLEETPEVKTWEPQRFDIQP